MEQCKTWFQGRRCWICSWIHNFGTHCLHILPSLIVQNLLCLCIYLCVCTQTASTFRKERYQMCKNDEAFNWDQIQICKYHACLFCKVPYSCLQGKRRSGCLMVNLPQLSHAQNIMTGSEHVNKLFISQEMEWKFYPNWMLIRMEFFMALVYGTLVDPF